MAGSFGMVETRCCCCVTKVCGQSDVCRRLDEAQETSNMNLPEPIADRRRSERIPKLIQLENEVLSKAEAWYDGHGPYVPSDPIALRLYLAVGTLRAERQRRIRELIK